MQSIIVGFFLEISMHLIKFTLGILLLFLAVPFAAYGLLLFYLGHPLAFVLLVFVLFIFDWGLEWSFGKGMAPWWRDLLATATQKETADELGITYPVGICRGEMSDLLLEAKHRGHIPRYTMADSELCEVYSAANTQEAHVIKAALENANIDSLILGDDLQDAAEGLPVVAIAPEVWVRTENSDVARDIIAKLQDELRRTKSAPALEWKCNQCGEINEPTFELCWNCQAVRDS